MSNEPSTGNNDRSIPFEEGAILQLGPLAFGAHERWKITNIDGDDVYFEYRVGRNKTWREADEARDLETVLGLIDDDKIDIIRSGYDGNSADLHTDRELAEGGDPT